LNLEDRELEDIGVTGAQAEREGHRFW